MTLISDTWREIRAADGRGWTARRLFPESRFEILAGRRGSDDAEALLFEVASRSISPASEKPECLGFRLQIEPIEAGPSGRSRLCLVIKDKRYLEVFATLVQDVADRVVAAADESAAVHVLLSRLNTWQRFLERFGLNTLTREEEAGLVGELLVLEMRLIPTLGPACSVRSWRGPLGEPQDYRAGDVAIEVKATTAREPASFQVANLEQLDHDTANRLFVCQILLEIGLDLGVSLPELISRLRTSLAAADPGAVSEFDSLLLEAGYLDLDAPKYQDRRYRIRHQLWYDVRDAFPRLTRATVPSGITSARYSVALAECAPFEIEWNEVCRSLEARVA